MPQLTPGQAFRLLVYQFAMTLTLSALLLVYGLLYSAEAKWVLAYSGLTGGLIATLANAWFTFKVFAASYMDDPARVLRSLYWGEINKLILTGAMFLLAFVLLQPVSGAALIAVYFIVHMTPFMASMCDKDTQQ